jgi:hypothetical protein
VLIFPAKWKKQEISTHASRISAKLGHAISTSQSTFYCTYGRTRYHKYARVGVKLL